MTIKPKLDPASVRWFQRQRAGPAAVQKQLDDLESGFQREADWRKSEALRNIPVWIARRKAMGSHR